MRVTHRALALAAAGLLGVGGLGQAQDLEFKGTTQGCFVPQGDVSCSPSSTANFQDLVYHSGSFDVFSFLGSASIGSSVNNLGTFNLSPSFLTQDYNNTSFWLSVLFTKPTVTGGEVFTAMVSGQVQWIAGALNLVFDPSSQVFNFTNNGDPGRFTLKVNNLSVDPSFDGGPVALTGSISSITATPEPGTTALLATGLLGLIPVVRLSRRKASLPTA